MSGFQTYPNVAFQRIVLEIPTLPRVSTYTCNGDGTLATETDPDGLVSTFAYNGDGTLHTVTSSIGTVTTFTYDGSGNLTGSSTI